MIKKGMPEKKLDLTRPSPQDTLARIDEIRKSIRVSKLTDRVLSKAKRAGCP